MSIFRGKLFCLPLGATAILIRVIKGGYTEKTTSEQRPQKAGQSRGHLEESMIATENGLCPLQNLKQKEGWPFDEQGRGQYHREKIWGDHR